MSSLVELLQSGRLVWWLALAIGVEILVLTVYWRLCRRGIAPLPLLVNMGSGGCLIVALGVSLVAQSFQLVLLLLALSFCFHVADIALRWQS